MFRFYKTNNNFDEVSGVKTMKKECEKAVELVNNVIYKPSHESNYSKRVYNGLPVNDEKTAINLIDTFIIHDPGIRNLSISNKRKCEITIDELTLADKKKSAHFTLGYDGDLYLHVHLHLKAWHAGESEWVYVKGKKNNLNNNSIGIEVIEPYSDIQYWVLAYLIYDINKTYINIIPNNIVGHYHVSPGRKSDPINFDWWKLFDRLSYIRELKI